MVLAARHLERIADNAVDIGERISYVVTGDWDGTGRPRRRPDAGERDRRALAGRSASASPTLPTASAATPTT